MAMEVWIRSDPEHTLKTNTAFDFKCIKCCPNISINNVLKNVQTVLEWDYKAGNREL